ncbi:hypothetical protein BCR35DRAFT_332652 [Leucosporidium creatinivorum]|uniref:Uncharacterized protein n=1 Tax=Leucosporidium creatinivorum TaxID=106004 RepID=A0A1Y2F1A4_9BASI|nr:hypothetical protein BCR35DRAFT_332652 [Leucosporidium creatinivorum]
MPVSIAEATARFGHLTPGTVAPMPSRPFTSADILSMVDVSTGVAHCFTGPAPLFQTPEGSISRTLSEKILYYDAQLRARASNVPAANPWRHSRPREEVALINRFIGSATHQRPYVELMGTPASLALIEAYCKRVCSGMLRSSNSLDSVDPVLFVCVSNWERLSGWEVGKALLAARGYAKPRPFPFTMFDSSTVQT